MGACDALADEAATLLCTKTERKKSLRTTLGAQYLPSPYKFNEKY